MKLAVLSDIHGNLAALEAVLEDLTQWGPDRVVVNGDLVSRGPLSAACLTLLQQAVPQAYLLAGNHEEYVLANRGPTLDPKTPQFELTRFAYWSAQQLGPQRLQQIAQWPHHLDLNDLEGGSVHITHGSRLGHRTGIGATTPAAELPARIGDPRDLFIVSHTHKPLIWAFHRTLIVNVGSVGSPMDSDQRASYGRFTFQGGHWRAEIRRVRFDRTRTQRDFWESGFIEAGGLFARLILAEFLHTRGLVGHWMHRYHDPVMAGEIGLAESIRHHLHEKGFGELP